MSHRYREDAKRDGGESREGELLRNEGSLLKLLLRERERQGISAQEIPAEKEL